MAQPTEGQRSSAGRLLNPLTHHDIRQQIERLPLQILKEILAGLSGGPRKDRLPPVTQALRIQYEAALELNKPDSYVDLAHFPLRDGLDALAVALEQVCGPAKLHRHY